MTLTVIVYLIYLTICIGLTIWVANVLFSNATVFFRDIFNNNEELSDSINQLLKVGFYLINIGLVLFLLETNTVHSSKELVEVLSWKVGGIVMLLGTMHLTNVYLFFKLRKKATIEHSFNRLVEKG